MARVDADLAAAGIHPAQKSRRSTLELTDRERDVAVLVAQGLTNPEVAEQLYISRKAVEYHLGNTYAKLGITSRKNSGPYSSELASEDGRTNIRTRGGPDSRGPQTD